VSRFEEQRADAVHQAVETVGVLGRALETVDQRLWIRGLDQLRGLAQLGRELSEFLAVATEEQHLTPGAPRASGDGAADGSGSPENGDHGHLSFLVRATFLPREDGESSAVDRRTKPRRTKP